MLTYWLQGTLPSLNGSTQLTPAVSPVSDASSNFVQEVIQNHSVLGKTLEMNHILPSQYIASMSQLPESAIDIKTPPPTGDQPPDFNAFKQIMGRRKTDICIEGAAEKNWRVG
jgi:hypothetical protein